VSDHKLSIFDTLPYFPRVILNKAGLRSRWSQSLYRLDAHVSPTKQHHISEGTS